ncbi:hypothetical protein LAUMK21_01936 [Mycobacterium pseudokansasii]|nr:hypothetical protein LAUMK21_01936 [Mycobacterium pseudokansasii]
MHPTSSGSNPGSACTWAANRLACAVNASADLADTTHGTTDNRCPPPVVWSAATGAGAGACSRITWALVPLIPNDDTPARRGRPSAGHSRASVNTDTAPLSQSTRGEGASTCSVAGIRPCRIACTILMTPATPAAAWV